MLYMYYKYNSHNAPWDAPGSTSLTLGGIVGRRKKAPKGTRKRQTHVAELTLLKKNKQQRNHFSRQNPGEYPRILDKIAHLLSCFKNGVSLCCL